MDTPSSLGRGIAATRRYFNSIDLKTFGIIVAVLTWLAILLIVGSAFFPGSFDLTAGDVAPDLIRAPRTLTFENTAETQRRRSQAADETPKVYVFDGTVLPRVTRNINSYFDNVARIIAGERAAAQAAAAPYDTAKVTKLIQEIPGPPPVSDATAATLASLDDPHLAQLRNGAIDSTQRILEGNVTDSSLSTDKDRLQSVIGTMSLTPQETAAAGEVAAGFLEPNNIYNADKTQQAKDKAAADVQPVMATVRSGETILTPGQVITDDNIATLKALGLTEQGRKFGTLAGLALIMAIEIIFMALYMRRFERHIRDSRSLIFIAASLLVLFTFFDRISVLTSLSPLLVPMAALGMLGTLMLGTRMSANLVILASVNLAIVAGSDPQFILVGLFGGLAAVFLVTHVSQRRDLMRAGLIAGLVVIATAAGASQIGESSLSRLGTGTAWGVGNAVLAIMMTIGLLTVYEMVFNLPTPQKLLELADPTRPLLKELMMKAPGTYNHSIIMGNIAEAAAEAIGANQLLSRVGAYYHDIGKLNRPDYFIENQFHVQNPHDRLTPGLSRLAITSHVKDGVTLATEEGLPPDIIDIIKEHHGTTVLSYFYHKAKEIAREGPVDEEAYRYAGHKPASREAAIIMLADSVEAAVRSLRNPTPRRIKTVIRDIFDQRLRDGQLSESRMTFGDLEKVRKVFEKSLQGFGAMRIAYPSEEKKEARKGRGPAAVAERPKAGREPVEKAGSEPPEKIVGGDK
ncbi:MAG: HDIG domain-containing protein [Actinobacteria bacterium]|nr:HDIG domain-containing protein [Actinomycetota bacterium]